MAERKGRLAAKLGRAVIPQDKAAQFVGAAHDAPQPRAPKPGAQGQGKQYATYWLPEELVRWVKVYAAGQPRTQPAHVVERALRELKGRIEPD